MSAPVSHARPTIPPSAAAVAPTSLAMTGFSTLTWLLIAFTLVMAGLVLIRVGRRARVAPKAASHAASIAHDRPDFR